MVNTQSAEPRSARRSEESDRPGFDEMVRRKRAETGKGEAKSVRAAARETKETEEPAAAPEEAPAEDAVAVAYAAAAAMLSQAQIEPRPTVVSTEDAAAMPTAAPVVTVAAEQPLAAAEASAEAPQEAVTENPVQLPEETFAAAAEAQAGPAAEERPAVETPRTEAPAEAAEKPQAEPARETGERPAAERAEERVETVERPEAERRPEQAARGEETAPREQRVEARSERRPTEAPAAPRRAEEEEDETGEIVPQLTGTAAAAATELPVRAAANPVALEAPDAPEQLDRELADFVQVNAAEPNRVEITLTPEHLGKLTVEIARDSSGALSVVLHPSTMRAANLLERSTGSLQALLMNRAGGEVEVRVPESGRQQMLDPNGEQQQQQQQEQQRRNRRDRGGSPQEFLQQLRLGLVEMDS